MNQVLDRAEKQLETLIIQVCVHGIWSQLIGERLAALLLVSSPQRLEFNTSCASCVPLLPVL